MKGLLQTKEAVVFYCLNVCCLAFLQGKLLLVKVKKKKKKLPENSNYVLEDNLCFIEAVGGKKVFNPTDAYWKDLKCMCQHDVRLSC